MEVVKRLHPEHLRISEMKAYQKYIIIFYLQ
jgi:hypothetical protein